MSVRGDTKGERRKCVQMSDDVPVRRTHRATLVIMNAIANATVPQTQTLSLQQS